MEELLLQQATLDTIEPSPGFYGKSALINCRGIEFWVLEARSSCVAMQPTNNARA